MQKNSLEIDQLKKEIEEVSNWKFILDNNIVKTNAGKMWIPKEKKSEMIMFMHVMLSYAGAEKVTKYVADNYDMSSIKESVKDIISKCL